MNRFGWQGDGFGEKLQEEKDRANHKSYYLDYVCDICGKNRGIGSHVRCSEMRKRRGNHGQT